MAVSAGRRGKIQTAKSLAPFRARLIFRSRVPLRLQFTAQQAAESKQARTHQHKAAWFRGEDRGVAAGDLAASTIEQTKAAIQHRVDRDSTHGRAVVPRSRNRSGQNVNAGAIRLHGQRPSTGAAAELAAENCSTARDTGKVRISGDREGPARSKGPSAGAGLSQCPSGERDGSQIRSRQMCRAQTHDGVDRFSP